ncbi:beta-lactamase [Cellulomonas carbonis T26]|uniref:Beta-lactamase n=2 Tax=Cellulomonas carbonis TaxID=1386092 RepID=A0A0A0BNU8_9CELL|nr:beta-lactamase [Cellulomonas carbonis T26]
MMIRTVVAPLLGTNCYLLHDEDGSCVVVDPGAGALDQLLAAVHDDRLVPRAVLVTHGHVDHTWSAGALSRAWAAPVVVHEADAYRLADPFGSLGPLGGQLEPLGTTVAGPYEEPTDVVLVRADGSLPVEGLDRLPLRAVHCPGHTEGSTVYLVDDGGTPRAALTGDVLFAGTIGRTDLPGGDASLMAASLARLADLPGAVAVLPGHGPASTVADELRVNPYLRR